MHLPFPPSLPRPYAVEDTAVELTWTALPSERLVIGVGPSAAEVEAPLDQPGALVVGGLRPATEYPVWYGAPGRRRRTVGTVRTLPSAPGAELTRFATVSDLHVGERRFGLLGWIRPDADMADYPVRCARAALEEAAAWGATALVAKGDLSHRSRPGELATAAGLLRDSGLRLMAHAGNHDAGGYRRGVDLAVELGPDATVAPQHGVATVDLPGIRVVLVDSARPGRHAGLLDPPELERIEAALADAPGPALVSIHHPPRKYPVPTFYPPGLIRPDTRALTETIRRANPTTVVVAGHSHRNRTYRVRGVLVAEVGSTKDYPGGWAGYAVHEGGLRQVVRRTARPEVLAWTERTRIAVAGAWGVWSPGRLVDRCWSRSWAAIRP